MLSREDQVLAEVLIHDIQGGDMQLEPGMTFQDCLNLYRQRTEDGRVDAIVSALGVDRDMLVELMRSTTGVSDPNSYGRLDALRATIDVDKAKLPDPDAVDGWDAQTFAKTLRHDEAEPLYNPSFRQLIHVSFKVAAELKDEYIPALERSADGIGREIEANIGDRHVKLLFA